jgi:hypothetical protein
MATTTSKVKPASASPASGKKKVNVFHQRLGSLTHYQACQLLGDEGAKLIQTGGRQFEIQSDRDVFLGSDLYRIRVEDLGVDGGVAIATVTLQSARTKQLQTNCDHCEVPCVHLGAALDYLLDAKSVLGFAQPPDESYSDVPWPSEKNAPVKNECEFDRHVPNDLGPITSSPAKGLDEAIVSQFVIEMANIPTVRAQTFAPIRWGRASIFCTFNLNSRSGLRMPSLLRLIDESMCPSV